MKTQNEDAIITNVTEAYDYVFKKLSIRNLKKSPGLSVKLGIFQYVRAHGILFCLGVVIFGCGVMFANMPLWFGLALMILYLTLITIWILRNQNILPITKINNRSLYDFRKELLRQKLKSSFAHGFFQNNSRQEWIDQCDKMSDRKLISTSLFYATLGVILLPMGNLLAIIPFPFLTWYTILVVIVFLLIMVPKCQSLIEEYNLQSKYYKQLGDMLRELPEDKLFASPTENSK